MPDKKYAKGCGKSCIKCWENRINHGSKLKRKMFPKMFMCDNEYQEEYETKPKVYLSNIHEFQDKYIYTTDSLIKRLKIYGPTSILAPNGWTLGNDYKIYNKNQIIKITKDYNEWLSKEKRVNKQVKEKDLINLLKTIVNFNVNSNYYKKYLMIDSNYFED